MEFVKLKKFGFIGLGNVGGKLAGSLIRNGCDLVSVSYTHLTLPTILLV